MSTDTPDTDKRYRAFISYSHRDAAIARWLHRSLESYRVPRRLVGQQTAVGAVPQRLAPIFLDRDELASAADLTQTVRDALHDSANLIVICSPRSAQSIWVQREVELFTATGRADRIFCFVVDGDPAAPAGSADSCFPAALLQASGTAPLAADIRDGNDTRSSAKLKLVAGVLGLPLGELRRREQARRIRQLTALAITALVIIAVLSGLLFAAVRAREEAVRQRNRAEVESQTALQTVDFLKSLFAVSNPDAARGNTITARAILDEGATRIETALKDQPLVRGRLMSTLGEVYTSLGLYPEGISLLERSRPLLGTGTPHDQLEAVTALGEAQYLKGEYADAEKQYRVALKLLATSTSSGAATSRVYAGLAEVLIQSDGFDAAEKLLNQALAIDRALGEDARAMVARDIGLLATMNFYRSKLPEAEAQFRQAIDLRSAVLGPMHPRVGQDLNSIGAVLYTKGNYAAAAEMFKRALPIYEKAYGPDHPETSTILGNLARISVESLQFAAAQAYLERTIRITLKQESDSHRDLAFCTTAWAWPIRGSAISMRPSIGFARRCRLLTNPSIAIAGLYA